MIASFARWNLALVILAMLTALAVPARADYAGAVAAYKQGAYGAALREFERLARAGDDRAAYYVAMMHKDGQGVAPDSVNALTWFLCAAAKPGGLSGQAATWRDRLTEFMTGDAVAAAKRRARSCSGQVHATVRSDANDRTAVPRSLRNSNRKWQPPAKRSVLVRIFYFPADATINGAQYFADVLGLDRLAWDLQILSRKHNNFYIGLFALFWWFLIAKAIFQACSIWFGPEQATGPGASQRAKRRPARQS